MCDGDRVRDLRFAGGARHERWIDGVDRDEIAEQRDDGISHESDSRKLKVKS